MRKRKKSLLTHDAQARLVSFIPSARPLGVLAGVALIVCAVFLSYLPAINGGFVLDDDLLVTENKIIKSSDGLYRFWCTTEPQDYWPITNTTFWIEWRLWGMKPTGYHVTNLVLHIIESLLIWVILRKISIPGAFLAALIFAVHPVNVESVAWIASRKSLMAMLFFLLSILCYLKFLERARVPLAAKRTLPTAHCPLSTNSSFIIHYSSFSVWYWLSLVTFIMAMLSKGSVAVLPVLLLGIIWWLRPLSRWDFLRLAPFFAIAVVLTGVNLWFQKHGSAVVVRDADIVERLLGAGGVVWFYFYKAIFPVDLAFIYRQWQIQVNDPLWWLPLFMALGVTAILWRYRKSWSRPFLFAWGFFCAGLVPVMGFTDVGFMQASLVADHYQHIAIIGVIALAAAIWGVWHQRSRDTSRWAATALAVLAVGLLAFLTWLQSGIYRDANTLYQDTIEKNPDCYMAHYNLANALRDAGKDQQAIEHYKTTLALKSDYVEAHNNLGVALAKNGRVQEAAAHFEQAMKIDPNLPDAYNNLGMVMAITGRKDEAIQYFQNALRLKADYLQARCNLGSSLVEAGRYEEAVKHFEQVLTLRPDLAEIYFRLAKAYDKTHQSSKAVATAQKALELARPQGQTVLAKEIEDWLKSYRAGSWN